MEKESGEQELWSKTLEEGLLPEENRRQCCLRAGEEEPPRKTGINRGGRKRKKRKPALHRCCYRVDSSRAAQKPSLGYWRNYYLSTSLLADSPQITVECGSFQLWHKVD